MGAVAANSSFTPGQDSPLFNTPALVGRFTGGTYATGGQTCDFQTAHSLASAPTIVEGFCRSLNGSHVGEWDSGASKWILYVASTGAEVANATDLSAVEFIYTAYRSM